MTSAPPGTYAVRRAAGLCGRCGSTPSRTSYCGVCTEKRAEERATRREARTRAHLCIEEGCPARAIKGQTRCGRCQGANNDSSRASHARRKARG